MGRFLAFTVLLTTLSCVYGREKAHVLGGGDDDDIAGPVVKSHGTSGLSVVPISANVTLLSNATLSDEKKKTIAQIIDEALEQEFPEEKPEKIGKNYNETSLQEDVSAHARPPLTEMVNVNRHTGYCEACLMSAVELTSRV